MDAKIFYNFDTADEFSLVKVMKASVKESAKLMSHPIENGTVITDHKVITPVIIDMDFMVEGYDYQRAYRNIQNAYKNGKMFQIQTRIGFYQNMVITAIPHEETPATYDLLSVNVTFMQVFIAKTQIGDNASAPKDTNTVTSGTIQGNTPTATQTSTVRGNL